MKGSFYAALAGFALISGSVYAADMPVKAPLAAPPPPAATWTGCYVNAGIGFGMWNQEHFGETFPGLVPLTNTFTSGGQGWLGRLGGGCDYQLTGAGLANWLIGAFGDYDFMSLKSKNFADVSGVGAMEKESGAWSAGARVGYLVYPNLLTFVSGGWTQTHFDQQNLFSTIAFPAVPLGAFMPAHTYNGAFLGGGYEYRLPFLPSVTWKTEYRYDWYKADDLPITFNDGVPTGAGENSKKTVQTITSSLVWRFDWH
jgi:outer membrane immunogenic protein